MIAATIDPLHWKTELERVGPRLKMDIKTLGKEWRAHIEQTKHHEQQIQKIMPRWVCRPHILFLIHSLARKLYLTAPD